MMKIISILTVCVAMFFVATVATPTQTKQLTSESIQKQKMLEAKAKRVVYELKKDPSLAKIRTRKNIPTGLSWEITAIQDHEVTTAIVILHEVASNGITATPLGVEFKQDHQGRTMNMTFF